MAITSCVKPEVTLTQGALVSHPETLISNMRNVRLFVPQVQSQGGSPLTKHNPRVPAVQISRVCPCHVFRV